MIRTKHKSLKGGQRSDRVPSKAETKTEEPKTERPQAAVICIHCKTEPTKNQMWFVNRAATVGIAHSMIKTAPKISKVKSRHGWRIHLVTTEQDKPFWFGFTEGKYLGLQIASQTK